MSEDLVGSRFGRLVVIQKDYYSPEKQCSFWKCVCDCGKEVSVRRYALTSGKSKSCGCLHRNIVRSNIRFRNIAKAKQFKENRIREIIGNKFNLLTVVELDSDRSDKRSARYYHCRCDCGNVTTVRESDILSGATKSCGCLTHLPQHVPDLVGKKVGRLTVLRQDGKDPSGNVLWLCRCECGNDARPRTTALQKGTTRSCGCLGREINVTAHTKHGMSHSKEYKTWCGMKKRCSDPNNASYKHYGGRGIRVCDEWIKDFSAFYEHIGPAPSPNHSINRIKNDGHYEPGNVQWVDGTEQNVNKGLDSRSKSGVTGVSPTKDGKWMAQLVLYGECLLRKRCDTFEEAVAARVEAEKQYFVHVKRVKDITEVPIIDLRAA